MKKAILFVNLLMLFLFACVPAEPALPPECTNGDIWIHSGSTCICDNGIFVLQDSTPMPDLDAKYPLRIHVVNMSWTCVTTYDAGPLHGGIGSAQSGGDKSEEIHCPDSPNGYPVKTVKKYYFYQYKTEDGYINNSMPYLQKSQWDIINVGSYRCFNDFTRWDWNKACKPLN